ncbi:MAG: CDP-diacylglycerol--serine O-phosphatidyltransferase [Rhodospirillales bacterium]|jgi:CDP-diacylglycerol--serine O-phosphatidyltransferase|nr:CDP-diacylglycerol--serine O-phosphatidyltransferase [Rhodospirillaceae bacterium]MDP6429519.1 CDP-diacylglycerol--serine O-phosphatidyltransferase [Rhodospirillales bacterium]MDP6646324.1 CDP-diacylglycerol--serine O-phosphatidyltransferase [Rhodospirillales bacterium]|tara:strand:+ start:2375 stop:3193 length:819 start_codon:yes stop_codon:yes gene_type:complete
MFRPRRERLKGLSFNRMIPNILTMLALCAGLTALRYGLEQKWQPAILSLVFAAVLDALDGRIARILNETSKFGAELDSLSDFIGFGVAPALLLYLWTMSSAGPLGWVLVLLYSVCCALRLARFNTLIDTPEPPAWANNYFSGVPAPAGAGLVLLPMIISFQIDLEWLRSPLLVGAFIVTVSVLLVSRLPTYSFKNFRVQHRFVLFTMLGVGLLAALIVSAPWLTLTLILAAYIISFPLGLRSFRQLQTEAEGMQSQEGSEILDEDNDNQAAE